MPYTMTARDRLNSFMFLKIRKYPCSDVSLYLAVQCAFEAYVYTGHFLKTYSQISYFSIKLVNMRINTALGKLLHRMKIDTNIIIKQLHQNVLTSFNGRDVITVTGKVLL